MQKLMFEIPGSPIGQGRPKFSTINGHAKAYDPEKSRNYKAYVRMLATQAMKDSGFTMIEGPCVLRIDAYFEVPKSKSKKFREAALSGLEWPTKKPDADNIVKAILDALNGLMYKDDSCIVELSCVKYYSDVPRVEVYVDGYP
mgnify:CR=1 FL=1